ncbi:DoxX family protein [Oricola cellulosilytica]|uniref:DoxX family protein n=2 Tax=Oricola cellulosilytica TaxID=1429082 RepID=A0A4R0P9N0_9HYPH|nr:DoxX family protein [Oricola cellulosilytica]
MDSANTGRAGGAASAVIRLHCGFFSALERAFAGWFNGFAARLAFTSVLLLYYLNSGWNKLGEGLFGFLDPSVGAFASILPSVMEQYGFNPAAVPFFPWHVIVLLGTWVEIVLPVMIVIGLFSRISALGMIVFIIVQSYVDVAHHGLEGKFVGAMFDRFPDAIIFDQRLLWIFVLLMIVVNGPGRLSIDHLLRRRVG